MGLEEKCWRLGAAGQADGNELSQIRFRKHQGWDRVTDWTRGVRGRGAWIVPEFLGWGAGRWLEQLRGDHVSWV